MRYFLVILILVLIPNVLSESESEFTRRRTRLRKRPPRLKKTDARLEKSLYYLSGSESKFEPRRKKLQCTERKW